MLTEEEQAESLRPSDLDAVRDFVKEAFKSKEKVATFFI
jgi:hypothetical protein